jgi:hypothetical protein
MNLWPPRSKHCWLLYPAQKVRDDLSFLLDNNAMDIQLV